MKLHFLVDSNYSQRFIEVNNTISSDSIYLILGSKENIKYVDCNKCIVMPLTTGNSKIKKLFNLRKTFSKIKEISNKCERVYFHFLYPIHCILYPLMFKKKKTYWLIWGGDVYDRLSNYQLYHEKSAIYDEKYNTKISLKQRLVRKYERIIIRKFTYIGTIIKGDYKLLADEFGVKNNRIDFFYVNPLKFDAIKPKFETNKRKLNVLLGNSGDPSNNHFEIFDRLKNFKNIKVYCPLSYGDEKREYTKTVIKYGKELFGNNFFPLTEFMNGDEYLSLLNNIDIAVMNHYRQQALGNIFALIMLGKTVYLNSKSPVFEFLIDKQIVVHDSNLIDSNFDLIVDESEIRKINRSKVIEINSEAKSREYISNLYK